MDKIPKCQIPKPVRNDNRVFAFTLAEVLITLVIIGIVAALTIPNLLQKYQEQATVKKVQKFYSTLSNAYSLAVKENGSIKDWGLPTSLKAEGAEKIYEILFKPYFKIAKNCGVDNTKKCIVTELYKDLNNDEIQTTTYRSKAFYKFTLNDGSIAIFYGNSNNNIIIVVYDANGIKKPNQWGVDTFYFLNNPYKSGDIIEPFGINLYKFDNYCQKGGTGYSVGLGCAAWVVYKGNMDYLHCDGLTWDSRSCKEK